MKTLTAENLKKIIFEAFKDVEKGSGIGARECLALDDWGGPDECAAARQKDVEQHWWEYPEDVRKNCLDFALTYNNKEGARFHFPALMTASIDGEGFDLDVSIWMSLAIHTLPDEARAPHHGHREYVGFMKARRVQNYIDYYGFTPAQVQAIALHFLHEAHRSESDLLSDRTEWIKNRTYSHEQTVKHVSKEHYTLTLEDVIAIEDEEHRIVRDWFKAGDVNPDEWTVTLKQ